MLDEPYVRDVTYMDVEFEYPWTPDEYTKERFEFVIEMPMFDVAATAKDEKLDGMLVARFTVIAEDAPYVFVPEIIMLEGVTERVTPLFVMIKLDRVG